MSGTICPHCKNTVYDEDALLCHFCGNSLARTSGGALGHMRGAGMRWIFISMGLLLLAALMLTLR